MVQSGKDEYVVFIRGAGVNRLELYKELRDLGYKIAIISYIGFVDKNGTSDIVINTDIYNPDMVITELVNFGLEHKIAAVISFAEECLEVTAEAVQVLGLRGPSYAAVKRCNNKYLTRLFTEISDIHPVRYFLGRTYDEVKESAESMEFPIILKPLDFSGSTAVCYIKDRDELEKMYNWVKNQRDTSFISMAIADKMPDYWIGEEYIEGFEISVECFSEDDDLTILAIHDKIENVDPPYFIETQFSTPSPRITPEMADDISAQILRLFRAVGFTNGIAHVEFKIKNNKAFLLEINPRCGGGKVAESVFCSTGYNILLIYCEICLGYRHDIKVSTDKQIPTSWTGVFPEKCGILREVSGLDEVLADPRIKLADQVLKEGTEIKTRQIFDVVQILSYADTIEEAESAVRNAAKKIKVVIEESTK